MLVDGVRDRVWFWHAHLDLLHDLDGERLLHFDRVRLLHGVRNGFLDDLRDHLVHGNMDRVLNSHVDRVGLRNADLDVVRNGHGNGMWDWHSNLFIDGHGNVLHVLRVGSVYLLVVTLIVGWVGRGDSNHEQQNGNRLREEHEINKSEMITVM